MCTFSMISCAFLAPMPWMYCSAITTRLLVGMLTPAIRATMAAPVAGARRPARNSHRVDRAACDKREHDAHPASRGPASCINLLRLGAEYVRTLATRVTLFHGLY